MSSTNKINKISTFLILLLLTLVYIYMYVYACQCYRLSAKSVLNMITETFRQVCMEGVKISTSVEIYIYKAVSSNLHKILTNESTTLESTKFWFDCANIALWVISKKTKCIIIIKKPSFASIKHKLNVFLPWPFPLGMARPRHTYCHTRLYLGISA